MRAPLRSQREVEAAGGAKKNIGVGVHSVLIYEEADENHPEPKDAEIKERKRRSQTDTETRK
jgi:hypothetical protein